MMCRMAGGWWLVAGGWWLVHVIHSHYDYLYMYIHVVSCVNYNKVYLMLLLLLYYCASIGLSNMYNHTCASGQYAKSIICAGNF